MIRYARVKYYANGANIATDPQDHGWVRKGLVPFKDFDYNQYVPEDCVRILREAADDLCQNGFYVQLVDEDHEVVFSEKFQDARGAEIWLCGVAVAVNAADFLTIGPNVGPVWSKDV